MTRVYLDTSVLVAYYYPEALSETVQKLVRVERRPVISSLNEVELMSALSRKIREGGLSMTDGERIAALFDQHVESGLYRRIPVSEQHYKAAQVWLRDFNTSLRSLHAIHLAVAGSANLQLVTADKILASSATTYGIATQFLSVQN